MITLENKYEIVSVFTDYKDDFSKECEKIENNNYNGYYYNLFQVISIDKFRVNTKEIATYAIEYVCLFKREEITE